MWQIVKSTSWQSSTRQTSLKSLFCRHFILGDQIKDNFNISLLIPVSCFVKEACNKSDLDKSVLMAWVGSPAQSQMSLFLDYPFPRKSVAMSLKNKAEAVTRDMIRPFVSRAKCI